MHFSEIKSGHSYGGQEIEAFKSDFKASRYIYLLAGVHGDEVEGVYVLSELTKWLKEIEDDKLEVPIITIPILNVDGYQARTRVNSRGVDLNRNLKTGDWSGEFTEDQYNPGTAPLSEPENVFLDKLFSKFSPGLIISFHSYKPILNYNGACLDVANYLSLFNHYPVWPSIGYPTPGSLGTYAPNTYNAPVITFECPRISDGTDLKTIWKDNKFALTSLMQSSLLKSKLT